MDWRKFKRILPFGFSRYPFLRRMYAWLLILRNLYGASLEDRFALYFNCVMDLLWSILNPKIIRNPIGKFPCKVYAPKFNVYFYTRGGSDDLYNVLPFREGDVHDAILKPLSEGDVFIDVGANIGYYSILASRIVGQSGRVIAIEAFPDTAKQLRKNANVNGITNIEVKQAAVWSESGKKLRFKFEKGIWWPIGDKSGNALGSKNEVELLTTKIDDLMENFKDVNIIKVMKLDIEGAEYEALKGAEKTLLKVQFVVAECLKNKEAIMFLLKKSGFRVRKLKFTSYILAEREG